MTSLDPQQHAVAQALFALPAAEGFSLAGGSALLALGVIDRPTRDIDAFIGAKPGSNPGDVRPLADELTRTLTRQGWAVTMCRVHETFTRMAAERNQETVEIDLAVDSPPLFPVQMVNGLPVLALEDLAGRKILAIMDRAEGRDYTDLHALAAHFGRRSCIEWARQLDAGLTVSAIANAFAKIDRLADDELPTHQEESVRALFSEWGRELREA